MDAKKMALPLAVWMGAATGLLMGLLLSRRAGPKP
jgi:hypothetical protein